MRTSKVKRVNKGRGIVHLGFCFRKKMVADRIDVYSAQASFYLIMSLIPMLLVMVMMLKYTPLTEEMILDALSQIVLGSVMDTVTRIVGNVYSGSVTFVSIMTVSLIWVIGKGILGLSNGLNNIYRLRESRNYFLLRLRASFYAVLFLAAIIMSLGLLVLGVRFQNSLSTVLPFLKHYSRASMYTLIGLGLLVLTLIFALLYTLLPNRKKRFRTQLYGAVFTTVSWCLFSFFFKIYLTYATNLSIIYGGLFTIVVMMLWLYFCVYLFFFGAEINAWKENPDSFPF